MVVLLATVLLFYFDALKVQMFALLICVALYLVGGWVFAQTGLRRLRFLWPILLVILVWHGLTGSLDQGMSIVLRLVTIVGLSNLMTMSTRLSDLIGVLNAALTPLRKMGINTRPIEIAVALFMRFTPVFVSKGAALGEAWKARSRKRPSWRIIFPLSLMAIDDAEQVADALKARGGAIQQEVSSN